MEDILSQYTLSLYVFVSLAFACVILWFYSRPYRGPGFWMSGMFLQFLGWLMFAKSLVDESFWLNILGTLCLIEGELLVAIGICRFLKVRVLWRLFPISIAGVALFLFWHSYITPVSSANQITLFLMYSGFVPIYIALKLWSCHLIPGLKSAQRLSALAFFALSGTTFFSGVLSYFHPLNSTDLISLYQSDIFLVSVNIGLPIFIIILFSLAILTLKRIILDSQHHAARAKHSAARFESLMGISSAGLIILKDNKVVDANPRLEELLNLTRYEILGHKLSLLLGLGSKMEAQLQSADGIPQEYVISCVGGRSKTVEIRIAELGTSQAVAEMRDISTRKALELELRLLATRDSLTNALTRRAFYEQAASLFEKRTCNRHNSYIALLDLDHFKQINDTYGHGAGDECLRRFSDICMKTIRVNDIFARYGGEEFILVLDDVDLSEATAVLNRIRVTWSNERFECKDGVFGATVSIGAAAINMGEEIALVESHADKALYRSKESGRNQVTVYG